MAKVFFLISLLIMIPLSSHSKGRIALDFSYKGNTLSDIAGQGVVESGQTILKEFGRGDIDTVISLTPTFDKAHPAQSIHIEINVKNFRDGDLISESTPQITAISGQEATLSLTDKTLNEQFKLSFTAKTLQ